MSVPEVTWHANNEYNKKLTEKDAKFILDQA